MKRLNAIWAEKNYRLALIISVLLAGWMLSGLLAGSADPVRIKPDQHPDQPLAEVRARWLVAQPFAPVLTVRARTEPDRQVSLRAETAGRVTALPVAEGALVQTGDVICELAEEDRPLKLAEAEANLKKAQIDYDGAQRLKTQGYQSQSAIAAAATALAAARALVKRQQLELDYVRIRAPFDGVVNARPAELGAYMQRGDLCASLIDLDPLVVAGQVSESAVAGLHIGQPARARIAGQQRDGLVKFLSRDADSQTRAFLLELAVANPAMAFVAGQTAEIQVPLSAFAAHSLSPALLALDDQGRLVVKVIEQRQGQYQARQLPVQIVGDSEQGVWVTGLPERTLLITVGQEYVADGQQLSYQLEPAADGVATQTAGPAGARP